MGESLYAAQWADEEDNYPFEGERQLEYAAKNVWFGTRFWFGVS